MCHPFVHPVQVRAVFHPEQLKELQFEPGIEPVTKI